jgi:hypothetical protein
MLIVYSIISTAAKLASHQNGEPSESHGREKHHYPWVSAVIILRVNCEPGIRNEMSHCTVNIRIAVCFVCAGLVIRE